MPRVPTYDNFQTPVSGQPNVQFQAPGGPAPGAIAADQAAQLGQALTRSGDAVGKIALDAAKEANQVRTEDAMNQLIKARTGLQVEALSLTGRAALERPDSKSLQDEYGEKLNAAAKDIAGVLGNDEQRRLFKHQTNQVANQFLGTLGTHVVQQSKQFQLDTWQDTAQQAAKQGGLLWGDGAIREQSRGAIESVVGSITKANGWDAAKDKALIDSTRDKLMDPLFSGVIHGMLSAGKSEEAKAYYDANSAGMSLQTRVKLHDAVQSVDVLVRADNAASEVWQKLAPTNPNEPVRVFDMEQAVREKFRAEPKLRDAAITSLRQQAAAFNAQQTEVNSASINKVYGMIDAGAPLRRVQSSPEWLALPEAKRHEITKGLESEAATRAARGASDAARQVSQLVVKDKMALLANGADYLHDSDPDVLASKTRAQVEAMRTTYGFEGTQHLLQRFDLLQNKDAKLQARIDDTAFKAIVKDTLDIDPYGKLSSEAKGMLGNLKTRVDGMLQTEAQRLRRPLTTEEKSELMRGEAAKTVTVNGWLWNSDKPAAALTHSDAGNVVIPAEKKAQLIAGMKKAYEATGDKDYAPTTANLNRLYLKGVSPIAGLPNAK